MKNTTQLILLTLVLATTGLHAQDDTQNLDKTAMLGGTIIISETGTVQSTNLDVMDSDGADDAINNMIRKIVSAWRFEPAMFEGKPVIAQTTMYVRLVAHKTADGNFSVGVGGATFTADASINATDYPQLSKREVLPPMRQAQRDEIGGTVYLALRIDRQGKVVDAFAEQVNLSRSGADSTMAMWRTELAEPVVEAAKKWTFVPPTTGALASKDSWTVHLGVNISGGKHGGGKGRQARSAWAAYIPGPKLTAPWLEGQQINPSSPDALVNGAMAIEGTAPKLLTPIKSI